MSCCCVQNYIVVAFKIILLLLLLPLLLLLSRISCCVQNYIVVAAVAVVVKNELLCSKLYIVVVVIKCFDFRILMTSRIICKIIDYPNSKNKIDLFLKIFENFDLVRDAKSGATLRDAWAEEGREPGRHRGRRQRDQERHLRLQVRAHRDPPVVRNEHGLSNWTFRFVLINFFTLVSIVEPVPIKILCLKFIHCPPLNWITNNRISRLLWLLDLLHQNSTQNTTVIRIIRLMISLLCWPKVILLSGRHCSSKFY